MTPNETKQYTKDTNDIVYLDLFISVDFLAFALLGCSLELCSFPFIPKYTNQIAMVQTDHTPTHLGFSVASSKLSPNLIISHRIHVWYIW